MKGTDMHSPWGKIDQQEVIAEGVIQVMTSTHGGLKLDRERNALIPAYMRRVGGWYEEDAEWCIPFVVLKLGTSKNQVSAEKTLRDYFPMEWEMYFGRTLKPGESLEKDEMLFNEQNKNNLLVICAVGDWHEKIPKGFVGVDATIGGVRGIPVRQFIVPEVEYKARGRFSFVVDPTKYEERNF